MLSINFTSRHWHTWIACAAMLAVHSVQPTQAAPVPSITAGCAQPRTADAFDVAFTQATVQRHDLQQLTCAASMSAAAAARAPRDEDMQMLALDAQINLLDALQLQLETQTYQGGDAFKVIKAQWALGVQNGKVLSGRLARAAQNVPSIAAMRVAFELVSVSSTLVPAEKAYAVAASMIDPLTKLLGTNPKLLDGIGEMMLGRLYFQLPETAKGDLDLAAVHLQKAHEINKKNITFQRWYAESLMALERKGEAVQVLTRMLPLKPEPIERQSFADELRAGAGLAQRAGDAALADQLVAKRTALFREFPQLQTRQSAAVFGHGGTDPMSGKSVD